MTGPTRIFGGLGRLIPFSFRISAKVQGHTERNSISRQMEARLIPELMGHFCGGVGLLRADVGLSRLGKIVDYENYYGLITTPRLSRLITIRCLYNRDGLFGFVFQFRTKWIGRWRVLALADESTNGALSNSTRLRTAYLRLASVYDLGEIRKPKNGADYHSDRYCKMLLTDVLLNDCCSVNIGLRSGQVGLLRLERISVKRLLWECLTPRLRRPYRRLRTAYQYRKYSQ